MKITEDPLFFYIEYAPGALYVQRKQPLRATDNPLETHEEIIASLCKAALDKGGER